MEMMRGGARDFFCLLLCGLFLVSTTPPSNAADSPQWGEAWTRNQVSAETGLPSSFNIETGENIKWTAPLGTRSYAVPVVADGRIYIGTNNGVPRDARHDGDRGVLFCLDEATGKLLWQLVVPKLSDDKYKDWPRIGICSPATVEGDRVYIVSNRGEVMCLDPEGLANGNDGPYVDEARHMTPAEEEPIPLGELDADILWIYDMINDGGVYPHDGAHSSIVIHGDHLYLNTGNGVDNTHEVIRSPDAPSLITLDKHTGRLVAADNEKIAPRIFHATWSAPAFGSVAGQDRIFFCGGDGVCYAFKPAAQKSPAGVAAALERVWRFDPDPTAPKENVAEYLKNRDEGPTNIKGMPVLHGDDLLFCAGGDIWWGKEEAWLHCVDATTEGDVTDAGTKWSYALNKHACATPAIHAGLVYVADTDSTLHCVELATGKPCWTHPLDGRAWGSAFVADGKVFIGTLGRKAWVFEAGRKKRVLACVTLDSPTSSTPMAANGVLYIATYKTLYAIAEGAGGW